MAGPVEEIRFSLLPAAINQRKRFCESEKQRARTRMELVTLAWPFAGDWRDKSGDSFCNSSYKTVYFTRTTKKRMCVLMMMSHLTGHRLGAITGYNLKRDATPHLPLWGETHYLLTPTRLIYFTAQFQGRQLPFFQMISFLCTSKNS